MAKFNPDNFNVNSSTSFLNLLDSLTINNQKVEWLDINVNEFKAKCRYLETTVHLKGDVVWASGNFKATLELGEGSKNISVVETLPPPPCQIDVDTIDGVVHEVPAPSREDDVVTETDSLAIHFDYYMECECRYCGAPRGVRSTSKENFMAAGGLTRHDFTNHNDWEHNVDLTRNNLIKTEYSTCSDCGSYEL